MKTKFLIVLLILLSGNLYAQEKTFSSKELNGITVGISGGENVVSEVYIKWLNNTCIYTFILKNGDKRFSENYFYLSENKDEIFDMKKLEGITEGKYLILKSKEIEHLKPMALEIYNITDSSVTIQDGNEKTEFKIIKKE